MPRIPIIGSQKKPSVPGNAELSTLQPRFKAPGGKPPLPLQKSFSPTAKKQREN